LDALYKAWTTDGHTSPLMQEQVREQALRDFGPEANHGF
jgi:hypothetical protein